MVDGEGIILKIHIINIVAGYISDANFQVTNILSCCHIYVYSGYKVMLFS